MTAFEHGLLNQEPLIRLGVFVLVFALVAVWEVLAPRRTPRLSRRQRWPANLGIVVLNTAIVRVLFPTAAVGMALVAQDLQLGLFNQIELPLGLAIVLSVVALDFIIWLQHVLVHHIPVLWRIHRVHHADLDYDLSTGARFHPIEIVLSMGIKLAAVALLGAPAVAVLLFEVLLNASAMFNHGNIRLPDGLDRVLRRFIVTPDMHRIHHSTEWDESNSNFGFNLSLWDRWFGTYREHARRSQVYLQIGIQEHTDPKSVARLPGMLVLPFKTDARRI